MSTYARAQKFADIYIQELCPKDLKAELVEAVKSHFVMGFIAAHDNAVRGMDTQGYRIQAKKLASPIVLLPGTKTN